MLDEINERCSGRAWPNPYVVDQVLLWKLFDTTRVVRVRSKGFNNVCVEDVNDPRIWMYVYEDQIDKELSPL